MRLRGPADKGDAVSALLKLRSLQRSFRRFREVVFQNQKDIMESLGLATNGIATGRLSEFDIAWGSRGIEE